MNPAELEAALARFEGLIKETASQIVAGGVELEFDDVRQLLRIKVWKAVLKFDHQRAADSKHLSRALDRYGRTPLERFVFMCVTNMRKDIEKRPRRFMGSIDELRDSSEDRGQGQTHDWFDAKYLSVEPEVVFAEVERADEVPLPSTLTDLERSVVRLRLEGRMLQEIDRELGLSRVQRERVMHSLREKLAAHLPASTPRTAPMRPLPGAEPRPARSPVSLAA